MARSQSRETVGRLSNLNPQRSIIPSGTKELKRTGSGRAPLDRSNSMHTDLTMDDDVFKVPTLPTLSQPQPLAEGIPDIAKELEKANKAVRFHPVFASDKRHMGSWRTDDQACSCRLSFYIRHCEGPSRVQGAIQLYISRRGICLGDYDCFHERLKSNKLV